MNKHRLRFPAVGMLIAAFTCGCVSVHRASYETRRTDDEVAARFNGRDLFTYRLRPPPDSGLPLEAGGYFHPLRTPQGVVITDFSPDDHKHHRGVFLGFVEMHGAREADFWGWGEHASIRDRRIVNRDVVMDGRCGFTAENSWIAGDTVLVQERLRVKAMPGENLNVLDLAYMLAPTSELTLSRWAFSGFCVRMRKNGRITMHSPEGLVKLKDPVHTKPESDWPDAPWYAAEIRSPAGQRFGVAVINHPKNLSTLWHNHRTTRMLNPCIVAPAEVKLKSGEQLTLRYLVATFDGDVPAHALNSLANEWRTE